MTSVIEVIAHHSSAISRISSWLAMRGPIALVVGRVLAAARRATAGSLTAGSMTCVRLVGFACVGSQLWGDVCDDATTFTKVRSLTHLLYTLSVSSFGVFFFPERVSLTRTPTPRPR